jgi:CheY-like chemotaxis protein
MRLAALDDNREPLTWGPKPRVLIVDDDPAFRHLVRHALERVDLEVAEAKDGSEALDVLRGAARNGPSSRFSVVVTDFQMPRFTGMQLVELLANLGVARQTILLSGFLDRDCLRWAELLGVAAVISKPLDFRALAQKVVSIAHERHSIEPRGTPA